MRIGLISDTHGWFHPRIPHFFKDCNEIWHAGDIGSLDVVGKLSEIAPLRAVYGNIDGSDIRKVFPEYIFTEIMGVKLLMIHIGGYPGRYSNKAKELISKYKPTLMIAGHSHIVKAIPDPKSQLLHLNPGAAGNHGWHKVLTLMRFTISEGKVNGLELIELEQRG
jgi:putative phosphoesterase